MHQPGIEPGSVPWQGTILPLDHWCYIFATISLFIFIIYKSSLNSCDTILFRKCKIISYALNHVSLCVSH